MRLGTRDARGNSTWLCFSVQSRLEEQRTGCDSISGSMGRLILKVYGRRDVGRKG